MTTLEWLPITGDSQNIHYLLQDLVAAELSKRAVSQDGPNTIYLFLTRRCNLTCQHCYIEGVGSKAQEQNIDLGKIRSIIDQVLPHGLTKVKVSGGEPVLHKDFMTIMEYLGSCGLKEIVLETNGTLFNAATIESLSELANLTLFVSLDHCEPDAHDRFRGKSGAFAKTAATLQELGKTNIETVVTTTAFKENFDKIPQIIERVFDWGIKKHRTLLNIHPVGNARKFLDNAITLEEMEVLIGQLLRSPHFESGRAYMTLPPALTPPKLLKRLDTCGWGESVLGILSNGQVSMCSASYGDSDMIAGNALETSVMEIWRNSRLFNELRDIGSGNVNGVCSNCVFYPVCRGVCKMSSWSHYREKNAPYPLCQEVYNNGNFPSYALVDPGRDCSYRKGEKLFKFSRPLASGG